MYDIIVGDANTKNVVLLEIEPELQNTYIDLLATSIELGIPVVCVTKVIKEGRNLYYIDKNGEKQKIEKSTTESYLMNFTKGLIFRCNLSLLMIWM